jgi:hypothetical protein
MAFESLLLDARGNQFAGSMDGITGETITDARSSTASLASSVAETIIDIQGKSVVSVYLSAAAFSGTVVFEELLDGINPLPAATINTATSSYVTSFTGVGAVPGTKFMITATGSRRIRVRVSSYTSGALSVTLRSSVSDYSIQTVSVPSIPISATAAAATALTLTIPAPQAGLFNYVSGIEITRNATVALAGTATLVLTTTNLPGSLAWSVGNAMSAGGTQKDVDLQFANPVKSVSAGLATTIVMPSAGAAVLWRATAYYYVAP